MWRTSKIAIHSGTPRSFFYVKNFNDFKHIHEVCPHDQPYEITLWSSSPSCLPIPLSYSWFGTTVGANSKTWNNNLGFWYLCKQCEILDEMNFNCCKAWLGNDIDRGSMSIEWMVELDF